jgi:hypothetical protein
MFCQIYQWKIEKELDDTGAVQSPNLLHHLDKCQRCRSYHQYLIQLNDKLRSDIPDQLNATQLQHIQTVVQRHLQGKEHRKAPLNNQSSHMSHQIPFRSLAAMLVLAAIAGLWFFVNRSKPSYPVSQLSFDSEQIRNQAVYFLQTPERSIENEIQYLSANVKQAVDFIQNCAPSPMLVQVQHTMESD